VLRLQFGFPFISPDGLARFGCLFVHLCSDLDRVGAFLASVFIGDHRLYRQPTKLDRHDGFRSTQSPSPTFGLERASPEAMELRRIYVDPGARRRGIARLMLRFAEDECRRRRIFRLKLSTSELQTDALASRYHLVREDLAQIGSNKTGGAGLRRFHFEEYL
jgi:putative acetyltransferase